MNNILLAYALNAENKLVHIDSVKNGLECGCVCPGCQEPLVAKNGGDVREHHFAHKSGNDCGTGYQTIRHIWAKELLLANRMLPAVLKGQKLAFKAEKIDAELFLKDLNIKPDILGFAIVPFTLYGVTLTKGVPFIVEIFVTHKVDDEKAKIIKKVGIPAIEIDLSKSTAVTLEELARDLNNKDNWKVINDEIGAQFYPENPVKLYRTYQAYSNSYYPARTVGHKKRYYPKRSSRRRGYMS